ncbi:phenylacetate--CoA ligase family protein [Sphingosinicella rhizophila]|uniref:Phenylacetate-CoA ligase n=1 Tax=Sphingosinicella rhizophila TaxID=3050082 RepID=A0ABU3Q654_9SPHN|nr:hypothetical protein [Sphingosinicella sp. GR2756]MDT9598898.1 hypothetical protein [Sphingosinicella sp. GR2756]
MAEILQRLYDLSPEAFQNLMVTVENHRSLRKRRRGAYSEWKLFHTKREFAGYEDLIQIQNERLNHFLCFAAKHSAWHRQRLRGIDLAAIKVATIAELPMMSKEDLRANSEIIATLPKERAYVAKTGGTTGAAIEVRYRWDDFQERTAMLDLFRERFVKSSKPRMAWFSGKALIPNSRRTRTYGRTNWLDRIRYYSTFHINATTVSSYLRDLQTFSPHAMIGFPSSMLEIARCADMQGLKFEGHLEAIFPTAEAMTEHERDFLREYFRCEVHDQYASSEGAPFITECPAGKLHLELLTGVFEVLDEKGQPATEGELVVTAFGTRGTPLIRYQIGDRVGLSYSKCSCGRETPLVERIEGRPNDFVYSSERGRINLGNISNSVKNVHGIRKFQVIQSKVSSIEVLIDADPISYRSVDEEIFLRNLRDRLGGAIEIQLTYVDDIPREVSGKHRIVKNSLDYAQLT